MGNKERVVQKLEKWAKEEDLLEMYEESGGVYSSLQEYLWVPLENGEEVMYEILSELFSAGVHLLEEVLEGWVKIFQEDEVVFFQDPRGRKWILDFNGQAETGSLRSVDE